MQYSVKNVVTYDIHVLIRGNFKQSWFINQRWPQNRYTRAVRGWLSNITIISAVSLQGSTLYNWKMCIFSILTGWVYKINKKLCTILKIFIVISIWIYIAPYSST